MKKNLIPKSTAKTAYGLLSDVCRFIIAEPQRIAMGVWKTRGIPSNTIETFSIFADAVPTITFPKCGTVGCIGGWTETLSNKRGHAADILGLDSDSADALFMQPALCAARNQQTVRHARAVISHVRRFQKQHAAQLKAKRV